MSAAKVNNTRSMTGFIHPMGIPDKVTMVIERDGELPLLLPEELQNRLGLLACHHSGQRGVVRLLHRA